MTEEDERLEGEEGTETAAEAEIREKAARAEQLEKDLAETQKKLKELEEDENSKDWRKARKQIKALEAALEKDGKVLDHETDEVKSKPIAVSPEDIDRRAEAAAEKALITKTVNGAKRDLSEEDRKLFDKFYEKATFGEKVTSDNAEEFVAMTFKLAGVGAGSKTMEDRGAGGRGGAPRFEKPTENFADSEAGKAVAAKMFGNLIQPKK